MNKANSIKKKLNRLSNENKIQTLFFDEESDVLIILDLETIEYKGVYLKYEYEGSVIELNTATNSLKVNDDGDVSRTKIDPLIRKSLDKVAVSKFNVKKVDEDYFTDLEDIFNDDIETIQDEETNEIYKTVKDTIKEIHDKSYDKDFITNQVKKFDIIEKKDHFNLERYVGASKIKYNSAKNKITVRNNYNFKEKFTFTDVVADFNTAVFLEVIREYYRKKEFDKRRLSLDDAFIDGYPVFTHTAALGDKDKNYDDDKSN
ncbi:hypothetical protein AB9Q04_04615 [Anaerococcus sp. ENR1011]|uniref:Large polyvalent protein associated domain-containing protein n=1 Tax=Anaerococcus groningensis TaxID=3115616 RepID=A0ABW9N0M7_9FIRM